MRTIRCIIVEDEPNAQKLLQQHISKVPFLSLQRSCYDGLEALEYIKTHQVDLLFLDINMPELTGIDLAGFLTSGQKIIFTTAYSEYALESYNYHTIDYLLKPIVFRRFMQAMLKVQQLMNTNENEENLAIPPINDLFVKSGKEMIKISKRDILYIEGLKEYVAIYTRERRIITYKRMKELEQSLAFPFIRVHNSYLINSDHIEKIGQNEVCINKQLIPIGQTYRKDFLKLVEKKLL
jgi:DNA-binding LytR/AlgR family response regulator